jgi:hypothetical protein
VSAAHGEQIIAEYLAQLELALAAVPMSRREEIVGEIREHIVQARAQLADESDADLHNLLDKIGDPAELASSARSDAAPEATPTHTAGALGSGWLDVGAVVLTPFLWPVGVILLWMSSAWSVRDKLIGTLVPPGGYAGVLYGFGLLFMSVHAVGGACGNGTDSAGNVYESCSGVMALPGILQALIGVLVWLVWILWLVLPVLTGIYLGVRLRRRLRASSGPAASIGVL